MRSSAGIVHLLVTLSVIFTSNEVHAAVDTSVCDPSAYPTYNGPALPILPDQLTWRIEANIIGPGKDYTIDFHQYIDYTNNKHALHYWKEGKSYWAIFKYSSNEQVLLTFPPAAQSTTEATTCQISPLDQSFFAQLLGDIQIDGRPHTARPLTVLRMSKYSPIKFLGKMTLTSGVKAVVWEGCLYNDKTGYTQKVTWYFSDPDLWYETVGKTSTPLLVSMVGSVPNRTTGVLRSFNHQYVFGDYRPYLIQGEVNSFQIPQGVYCKNDVNLKDLPTIPDHFTLRSEIIDGFTKTIGWTHEYYDSGLKLSRYDFKDTTGTKYGTNELKRIHDFNSGVAYIIDKVTGQCWTSTIKLDDYDNRDIDSTRVRLRTPSEFFDLDRSNYSYVGQPPISKTFNFYEFDSSPSNFHDYDVSACFDASGRADFLMVVPSKYKDKIFNNLVVFKQLVRISIQTAAVVSPVRVTNIEVDYNNTGLLLTFTLLDLPAVKGNVDAPSDEPGIDGAIANLVQALDAGQFTIYVQDPAFGDKYFTVQFCTYITVSVFFSHVLKKYFTVQFCT
ncbi:EF-hand domain-containing protein d1 [Plakobranchus ocellatus]|uniref:EF-hand domain-containing protein d1 n=1 Tax=Plakobranchus ocellatus TaxID=259542 RepID=A0AAV4CYT0_9GAST|nr:EF-hand domain-containing protein d1 [Plakobranchus ocellatus]